MGPPSVFQSCRLSLVDKQLNIRQNYENTGLFNHLQILNKSANSRLFSSQICYFGQGSLPVTCQVTCVTQPQTDRQCATCKKWHDDIGVTNVERPDPKSLPPSVSTPSAVPLETRFQKQGAPTKELASSFS